MDIKEIIAKIKEISGRIKDLEECNAKIQASGAEFEKQFRDPERAFRKSLLMDKMQRLARERDSNQDHINRLGVDLYVLQETLNAYKGEMTKEELEEVANILLET